MGVNVLTLSAPSQSSSLTPIGFLLGNGASVLDPRAPLVTTSLERRLSDRNWLALGLSGLVSRQRADVPAGASGVTRDDERALYVSMGLRRVVTRRRAPVEVSGLVYVEGGIVDAERTFVASIPSLNSSQDVTGWVAGAGAGISLERELTEGLSLRVASPLISARYGHNQVRQAGQPTVNASTVGVAAVLAPSLQLRLAF